VVPVEDSDEGVGSPLVLVDNGVVQGVLVLLKPARDVVGDLAGRKIINSCHNSGQFLYTNRARIMSDGEVRLLLSWLRGLRFQEARRLPKQVSLEHVNELEKVFGELPSLNNLRSINLRHNKLKSSGVPPQLFELEDLTSLDLSCNNLKELPQGIDRAKNLLVLNLSNNK